MLHKRVVPWKVKNVTESAAKFSYCAYHPKKAKTSLVPKVLTCDWLTSPEAWEKEKFSKNIVEFIKQTQGLNAYPDMVLIGMLTHQIDLYAECSRQIANKGLVADYNKGGDHWASLYFSMAETRL